MDSQVLIEQMPPADIVGAFRALVRCTPWPMELSMVDILALAITDIGTGTALKTFRTGAI
jgi:hypothetical protein